jgi:putative flippase GtrA
VRLVQRLPQRWQGLVHELAKFGIIGVVNLFVNLGVSNLLWLTVFKDSEVKGKAVATVVATIAAYFMNRHWTYRDRPKSALHREYVLFFFFNLVGLVIETAVLAFGKYGLHITHLIALNLFTGIGMVLGTIFRFWAYRTHVFKAEPVATVAMEAFASVPPEPAEDLDAEAAQIALDEATSNAAPRGPGGSDRAMPGQKTRRRTATINGR